MNIQPTIIIYGALWLLTALPVTTPKAEPMQWDTVTFADNYSIEVELADTEALRQHGLMYRTHLPENQGMLFIYQDQAIRGVWMKNTLIPLDILFLSDDARIISMLPDLQPCTREPCPISISSTEAQYMLEVNAGFLNKHGIRLGQKLIIEQATSQQKEVSQDSGLRD